MILNEVDDNVARFLDELENNCSDILNVLRETNQVLWRGVSSAQKQYYKTQPRTNRVPLNTPEIIHLKVDNWLGDHGFSAKRTNSMFVSSSVTVAHNYGELYFAFPSNGFDYTWFEKSYDLYDEIPYNIYDNYKNPAFIKNFMDGQIDKWLTNMAPRQDNIQEAIIKHKEIMLSSTPVYLLKRHDFFDIVHSRFGLGTF